MPHAQQVHCMQGSSTHTSNQRRWFAALKPLLLIVVFMILAGVLLITMEALGSGTPRVDWSKVLYVAGALALFAVLALRARKRSASSGKTHPVDHEQGQAEEGEEKGEKLAHIRRRIRQRKIDKLS